MPRRSAAPRRSSMYRVRTTTVPLAPDQCPSMSPHSTLAPTTGSRDRDNAHRKRQPRNAGAKGSSKSRVVAVREDSLALQRATTVAVRLTASRILLLPRLPAPDPWPGTVPCQVTRLVHLLTRLQNPSGRAYPKTLQVRQ